MRAKSLTLLAGSALVLGTLAGAQQTKPVHEVSKVGTAQYIMATGELIRGGAVDKVATKLDCFVNTDTSGYFSTAGAGKSDEWLDWGIFANKTGGIVTDFQFGYASFVGDLAAGGPGVCFDVAFYKGTLGFGADIGAQPQAAFSFTGLPGNSLDCPPGAGAAAGWLITVDLRGGFEFAKPHNEFGFSIKGGGTDPSGGGKTGPILCYAGDGLGGPDANGQVDAFDIYVPDLRGTLSGTFFFGGVPFDISSWYSVITQVDADNSGSAAWTVRNPAVGVCPGNNINLTAVAVGEGPLLTDLSGTGCGPVGVQMSVLHNIGITGNAASIWIGYINPLVFCLSGNGQMVLCNPNPAEFIFQTAPTPGVIVNHMVDIPVIPGIFGTDFCGATFCTQAVGLGGPGFTLSNALDGTFGFN